MWNLYHAVGAHIFVQTADMRSSCTLNWREMSATETASTTTSRSPTQFVPVAPTTAAEYDVCSQRRGQGGGGLAPPTIEISPPQKKTRRTDCEYKILSSH